MAYQNDTGLPSPSDILRPWINAEWLTYESRERGTIVHEACAAHLLGEYAVIDRRYRGYFDSFKRWCDEENPQSVIVEARLICDRYRFCGQPDFVGFIKSRGAISGVVDFKTSSALGKAWPLQIAAYQHLAGYVRTCAWGASVRLREDGSYPLVKLYDNYEIRINLFFSALNLWRHFNQ